MVQQIKDSKYCIVGLVDKEYKVLIHGPLSIYEALKQLRMIGPSGSGQIIAMDHFEEKLDFLKARVKFSDEIRKKNGKIDNKLEKEILEDRISAAIQAFEQLTKQRFSSIFVGHEGREVAVYLEGEDNG